VSAANYEQLPAGLPVPDRHAAEVVAWLREHPA